MRGGKECADFFSRPGDSFVAGGGDLKSTLKHDPETLLNHGKCERTVDGPAETLTQQLGLASLDDKKSVSSSTGGNTLPTSTSTGEGVRSSATTGDKLSSTAATGEGVRSSATMGDKLSSAAAAGEHVHPSTTGHKTHAANKGSSSFDAAAGI